MCLQGGYVHKTRITEACPNGKKKKKKGHLCHPEILLQRLQFKRDWWEAAESWNSTAPNA
jgi:hypothetical protein